jgi:hypothetical protein
MTVSKDEAIRDHAAFIWSVADLLRGDYKPCPVQVDPSGFPVDAKVIYQKSNQPKEARTEFLVRVANATRRWTSRNEREVHRPTMGRRGSAGSRLRVTPRPGGPEASRTA